MRLEKYSAKISRAHSMIQTFLSGSSHSKTEQSSGLRIYIIATFLVNQLFNPQYHDVKSNNRIALTGATMSLVRRSDGETILHK